MMVLPSFLPSSQVKWKVTESLDKPPKACLIQLLKGCKDRSETKSLLSFTVQEKRATKTEDRRAKRPTVCLKGMFTRHCFPEENFHPKRFFSVPLEWQCVWKQAETHQGFLHSRTLLGGNLFLSLSWLSLLLFLSCKSLIIKGWHRKVFRLLHSSMICDIQLQTSEDVRRRMENSEGTTRMETTKKK